MVKIDYHGEYPRDLEKILSEIPDLLQVIDRKIKLFQKNHTMIHDWIIILSQSAWQENTHSGHIH